MKPQPSKKINKEKQDKMKDPASIPVRIHQVQDKRQFEQLVEEMLKEHNNNRPAGIFY